MSLIGNEVLHFSKERVSQRDTFRCRKCRNYLFSFENLTSFHDKVEPVDQCSCWYLSLDSGDDGQSLSWIRDAVDESQWTEGKLYCPKCSSRIGAFNITQGVKCSCFSYVIPAVWIQKCKVDQVTSSDSKPNIRFPGRPTEPDCYHGNRHHGDQACQSSLQTRQSGNGDTSVNSIQTSQTRTQTRQTSIGDSAICDNIQTSQTRAVTRMQRIVKHSFQIRLSNSSDGHKSCDLQTIPTGFGTAANVSKSRNDERGSVHTGQTGSNSVNSNGHFEVSGASRNLDSQFLADLEYEQESESSSLQGSHSLQIWPNVVSSYKAFNVHQYQECHPCQCSLGNHSLRNRKSLNYNYNMYSDRKGKRSCKAQNYSDTCRDDCFEIPGVAIVKDDEQDKKQSEESEISEHLMCPICLDLLYEPLISPCDHVFCDSCLRLLNSKCRKSVPRCPLCRKSLNYVYPAVDLRDEIRNTYADQYRKRHKAERRAPHRRLPLPSGRLRSRKKKSDILQDVPMPYSVLVFLVCVLAVCVLCLVILFVFCPPSSNRCVTIIGYE